MKRGAIRRLVGVRLPGAALAPGGLAPLRRVSNAVCDQAKDGQVASDQSADNRVPPRGSRAELAWRRTPRRSRYPDVQLKIGSAKEGEKVVGQTGDKTKDIGRHLPTQG